MGCLFAAASTSGLVYSGGRLGRAPDDGPARSVRIGTDLRIAGELQKVRTDSTGQNGRPARPETPTDSPGFRQLPGTSRKIRSTAQAAAMAARLPRWPEAET